MMGILLVTELKASLKSLLEERYPNASENVELPFHMTKAEMKKVLGALEFYDRWFPLFGEGWVRGAMTLNGLSMTLNGLLMKIEAAKSWAEEQRRLLRDEPGASALLDELLEILDTEWIVGPKDG